MDDINKLFFSIVESLENQEHTLEKQIASCQIKLDKIKKQKRKLIIFQHELKSINNINTDTEITGITDVSDIYLKQLNSTDTENDNNNKEVENKDEEEEEYKDEEEEEYNEQIEKEYCFQDVFSNRTNETPLLSTHEKDKLLDLILEVFINHQHLDYLTDDFIAKKINRELTETKYILSCYAGRYWQRQSANYWKSLLLFYGTRKINQIKHQVVKMPFEMRLPKIRRKVGSLVTLIINFFNKNTDKAFKTKEIANAVFLDYCSHDYSIEEISNWTEKEKQEYKNIVSLGIYRINSKNASEDMLKKINWKKTKNGLWQYNKKNN